MRRLRFLLLATAPFALAAACTAVSDSNGPTGSTSATTSASSSGGGGGGAGGAAPDGGPDAPPAVHIDCANAADCAAFDDQCNEGSCVNGSCQKLAANEFGSCDDGVYCTENDTCQAGACVGGTTKFCPSQDTCHLGVCDEALHTCKNVAGNDGAQCDDDDACTQSGICNGGVCTKGPPIDCSVFDGQCSAGICQAGVGCVATPLNNGVACDDGQGNPCSTGQCQNGACISIPTAEGLPCDDFQFCTINDKCSQGSCAGSPNPCAPPQNVCMIGVCNEALDTCTASPGNNGSACEDQNPCTSGETCSNGQCLGGQPANQGALCEDGDGCTLGTTCQNGSCSGPTSVIATCQSGDSCCPPGCALNQDGDCLYYVPGVQQNVPEATLTGWTQCWIGDYAQSSPPLATLLQQCSKSKLLMACRPTGSPTWTLLAMAPRLDVLFDCGSTTDCTKQSNGVGWYYSTSYSWGFAPGGQSVNRNSCDYNNGGQILPGQRLCWHTGGGSISSGYRCGDNDLNGASNWQRALYHAD